MRPLAAALAAYFVLWLAPLAPAEHVWWEGESPAATNFPRDTWISASTFESTRRDILSNGDWLTAGGKVGAQPMFARYSVAVKGGDYVFWTRKYWKHGPFRWRFDSEPWRTCGRDVGLADSTDIRQWVCVNWVCLGDVKLTAGSHTFELQLLAKPGEDANAAFDCFLLTTEPFAPRGRFKPDEKSGKAEPGWWAFEPPADPFAKADLDLRFLNEKSAGETGFVKRVGDSFAAGDGRPIRFWAINVGGDVVRLGNAPHRYIAKRLAKVGVNLVRIHSGIFSADAPDPTAVDKDYLDALHHFIAMLKAEGIYVELSFYYPLWFDIKPAAGIPGYDTIANKKPFVLHMFDPRMQEIYRAWARALLTTKNPYTGLPLGQDPAVAIVEIVNEDSYLFWTFNNKDIPRVQMEKLEKLYGTWLAKQYKTLDAALTAWGGPRPNDAPKEGRIGLLEAWFMTGDGVARSGQKARASEQLRFLVENQRAFYEETIRFFRKDLGAKPLINCSNWMTADARVLDGLERWTYSAGDLIDQHGYFGGEHKGPHNGWAVERGDTFTDRAGVLEPEALPIHFARVEGFPQIMSEIGWPNPNRFKAEFPFLVAACASTSGLNGAFFFAVGDVGWESGERKFCCACPTIMGQFPALALMYRRGDLQPAPVVVRDGLALDDLYAFKGSGKIDPLAYCVGRVVRGFDKTASTKVERDLAPFINRGAKTLKSFTGELAWDWGKGVATVNAPKTQGATGFLSKAGTIELRDVAIESRNEFSTIVVTALDDKPLATSSRILIQTMTEEHPYGWKVEGGKVVELGGFPMNVKDIDASVTFKTRTPKTITVLDEQGYKRESHPGAAKVVLPPNAVYCIVE